MNYTSMKLSKKNNSLSLWFRDIEVNTRSNPKHLIVVVSREWVCGMARKITASLFLFLLTLFILFLERGEEQEKEGEKHRCMRECLSHLLLLVTRSETQECALTGNQTGDLSPCGMMPNRAMEIRSRPQFLIINSVAQLDFKILYMYSFAKI